MFSARQFEIISDFPAIIHWSQSFSFSFANGAPSHLPNFSSCDTSNRENSSLLRGRGMQTGYNHSANVHDPMLEKLSCCQQLMFLGSYLINHYGEVIATSHLERKVLCYLWPQGLRYTKNHRIFWIGTDPQGLSSPTLKWMVKSSCEWFSVSFAMGQLQLLWEMFSLLGHLFPWIQKPTCTSFIPAQDAELPFVWPQQLEWWA